MKLLSVLAATAVAAALAAALSITAGAAPRAGDAATKLATCLHAHDAIHAPSGSDPLALKRWLGGHADNAAVTACNPSSGSPAALVSCLRAHGLNPPGNVFQLKPWMAQQTATAAAKAALNACGVDVSAPRLADTGKDLAACLRSHGADVPAGADGLALKTWVRDHSSNANVMDALKLCGAAIDQTSTKANDCGGGAAQKPDGEATPTPRPTPHTQ
jgi:hypothetical protein